MSWDFMGFHGISQDFKGFHKISCDFKIFRGISSDFKGFQSTMDSRDFKPKILIKYSKILVKALNDEIWTFCNRNFPRVS